MAIFYHLSTDLYHNGSFVPRIPQNRHLEAEDEITPRISVAPSIENCLTAIPNGGIRLDSLNFDLRGYYLIFKIDTEKLGITEDQIVDSKTLFEKDLVRDADITEENWITVPFVVSHEDQFIINLSSWDEDSADVIPHAIYVLAEEEFEGDYFEAYEDEIGGNIPCCVVIQNAEYTKETVEADEEISLYFGCEDDEKDAIVEYLKKNYEVDEIEVDVDTIEFSLHTDGNLRSLFIYHSRIAMIAI